MLEQGTVFATLVLKSLGVPDAEIRPFTAMDEDADPERDWSLLSNALAYCETEEGELVPGYELRATDDGGGVQAIPRYFCCFPGRAEAQLIATGAARDNWGVFVECQLLIANLMKYGTLPAPRVITRFPHAIKNQEKR